MLPPVLASPTSYTSAAEPKLRGDQMVRAPMAAATPPMPATEISPNAAISGQLNIMMLSGPERMSQNLATLAEVLGSALKIEQRADEGLSDYMARLIEGIAALPAADRLKLQKLLTQVFAGLQLKTLLDAMANSSGPERATLALYLELYRQPDKDGATRWVISSYRELAAEGRANSTSVARPLPANDSVRPNAEPSRADLRPLPPIPSGTVISERDAQPLERPLPGSISPTRIGPPAAALQPGTGPAAKPPSTLTEDRQVQSIFSAKAAVPELTLEERQRSGSNIPMSFASERGRVPGNEPTVLRSGTQRLVGNGAAEVDAAVSENRYETTSPIPPQPAQGAAKPLQPLPAGWMAELLESSLVRSLLQLRTLSAGQRPDAPMVDRSRHAEPGATALAESSETPTTPPMEEQPVRLAQTDSRPALTDDRPLPPPMVPVDQTPARPLAAREGVPLPFVLYAIEDEIGADDLEAGKERDDDKDNSRHESDEQPDEDAQTSDPDGTLALGDPEVASQVSLSNPADDHVAALSGTLALPAPAVTSELRPEPAHELYLRMAGLT